MKVPKSLVRFVIGALGLALGLGYGHMQTQAVKKADQAKIREITGRLSQAQRRYTQEMASAQTACDDSLQALRADAEKLQKERETLVAENKGLKVKAGTLASSVASLEKKNVSLDARAASLESKLGHLTGRLAKTEADRAALEQKEHQTLQALQEREKDLKALSQRYDQCAEHNARLYTIGDELIRKYRGKGVVTTLLEKEPFTQIKRVELEKLARDYKDKIDQQKLRSK